MIQNISNKFQEVTRKNGVNEGNHSPFRVEKKYNLRRAAYVVQIMQANITTRSNPSITVSVISEMIIDEHE